MNGHAAERRYGGSSTLVPALRVTAIGRRGLLATKTFCCRNRPFGRFEQQNVLAANGHRRGGVSRFAKRSGATAKRLDLDAPPRRWQRGVWDLRHCAPVRFEKP